MMSLRTWGYIVLAVCWVLWAYPFFARAQRVKGREAAVTDRRAMRGLLLQTVAIAVAWIHVPGPAGTARVAAAMALAPLGPLLAWTAVNHLGRQWRIQAGLWHDHELVRTGPYRIVRHPVYSSMLALALATALINTSWWLGLPAIALFVAGTEIRVRTEDALLASRFGGEFDEYRRRVPAYVPLIR